MCDQKWPASSQRAVLVKQTTQKRDKNVPVLYLKKKLCF